MNAYGAPALRPRFDDLNLAESSLISALTRLKVGETSWEHSFEIAGREMHVECLGNSYGFPHGPDNDMMLVLNNLYLEQGQPDNNSVHCSAYALLKMLGRTDSSQNYRIMHDSLTRLAGTLYKVSGWLDQPGGATRKVTFRFLERVEEVQGGVRNLNLKSFGAGTQLKITLDSVVAASLKSSRVRPFDLDFMLKLSGSQSRMLFRLLDTLWYSDPRAIDRGLLEFEVVELGKLLRLTNLRPDSIRRTIVPIHEELVASEFLLAAAFEGRGQQQRVRYVLNPQRPDYPLTVEQLEFVGRIKTLGISDVQARAYVRKHAPARVRDRLQMVAAILSGTSRIRKSPAAYAWDILTDETGKYTYTPQAVSSGSAGVLPDALENGAQRQQEAKEASEKDLDERIESLRQLAPDEQWAQHRAPLKLLLHRPLGADLWKVLEGRCTSGRLEAATLLSEVNAAIAGLELQTLVDHLRAELKAPQS
ncbi:replication initiator protein A [Deinococcus altitudinis]|uniref:replication initiator protein A n=1 Tax=Deinococcus altitudinis TaxID=468914 RepID=UPI003892C6E5